MYVLARGGVGAEGVRVLGLGFTNPVGTRGVCDVCFGCRGVGGVGGVCGRVEWCYDCVCCESGLFVYMVGPCICILC